MKNILVPVGSSKNALSHLQYAVDFAKAFNAKLFIVQVYNVYTKAGTMIKVDEIIENESKAFLNDLVSKIDTKGVDLIIKTFNESKLVRFIDSDNTSDFKFELVKLELYNSAPLFSIDVAPSSQSNNTSVVKRLNEKQVLGEFQQWISWLKVFDKSHLTPEDEFLKNYQA